MLRPLALAPLAVLVLLLVGCSATPEPSPPSPSPSEREELFASEEEAVAAADALIKEYWAATNEVFQAGGDGVELLAPIVTERRMDAERSAAAAFERQQLTQHGDFRNDSTTFQQMYQSGDALHLVVTTCVDYSEVKATTPDGREAERASPELRYTHQVTLHVFAGESEHELRLDKSEPWHDVVC